MISGIAHVLLSFKAWKIALSHSKRWDSLGWLICFCQACSYHHHRHRGDDGQANTAVSRHRKCQPFNIAFSTMFFCERTPCRTSSIQVCIILSATILLSRQIEKLCAMQGETWGLSWKRWLHAYQSCWVARTEEEYHVQQSDEYILTALYEYLSLWN